MNKLLISLLVTIGLTGVAHAAGDAAAGKGKAAVCSACHNADGNSVVASFPKLAGQNEKYLIKQMTEIKAGKRSVLEMTGLLDNLNEQDFADIAAYFSKQAGTVGHASKDLVEQGEKIYRAGIQSKGVAACTACHSPTGEGNGQAGFPKVGGQHAAYTEAQLTKFRKGERNNDPQGMMGTIASKLSDAEIKAVASYIQGLGK